MYTLAHHRQGFAGCELARVPQRTTRSGDPAPRELYFDYLCPIFTWGLGNTYTEGTHHSSLTPICGWKTIFLVRCRGGSLLGLRWCQRIQLLIIDLACSQQNGADHPKESKRRNWERARYKIHTVCHNRDGRQTGNFLQFQTFPEEGEQL